MPCFPVILFVVFYIFRHKKDKKALMEKLIEQEKDHSRGTMTLMLSLQTKSDKNNWHYYYILFIDKRFQVQSVCIL